MNWLRLFGFGKKNAEEKNMSFDLRSGEEKAAEKNAASSLPEPLESYAREIVELMRKYPDANQREPKTRAIGNKMNDNVKQLRVAYRAQYLAVQAGMGRDFSMRLLEYAWDGLGDWRA